MDVLVIGGSRFVGRQLAHRLVARGDRVTLLNRGSRDDGLGDRVERLIADRTTDAFDAALAGRRFDAVVDFAAFVGADVERARRVLEGSVGHYVFIGTGQVYLVREGCPTPSRETDYEGPVMARPAEPAEHWDWEYGVGKRAAEDVLAGARSFPSTRIRIPMVHGPGDPYRRIERIAARCLDGGPLLVPRADATIRHVYGPSLAGFLADHLGDSRTFGRAFNVAMGDTLSVRDLMARIAQRLGSRAALVPVGEAELGAAGLRAEQVSPFGGRWMSLVDPSLAERELGLAHPPIDAWLPALVDHVLATHTADPPLDLAHRPRERALGTRLLRSVARDSA